MNKHRTMKICNIEAKEKKNEDLIATARSVRIVKKQRIHFVENHLLVTVYYISIVKI